MDRTLSTIQHIIQRSRERKTTPHCQSQLKSVYLKSKTTYSSLTTKTMSTDIRFSKKISQPFSGNDTLDLPFLELSAFPSIKYTACKVCKRKRV